MTKKGQVIKRIFAAVMAVVLAISVIPEDLQRKIGVTPDVIAETTLQNPRIEPDNSMEAGQKVTWDCVYFGSYPQTEIVDKPETCGTFVNEFWGSSSDYQVDAATYKALQNASEWNSDGDIILSDGRKYRRMKLTDATYSWISGESFYCADNYYWSDSVSYHYFRYDPVKWRVLETDGSTALLLADQALDTKRYEVINNTATWETSTIRAWLNGYDGVTLYDGTGRPYKKNEDYREHGFIDLAFTQEQQGGILTSDLINADGIHWIYERNQTSFGGEGGNDTSDKIFLLSESDVFTDEAKSHGFVSSPHIYDEARRCKSSTYAKAMGIFNGYFYPNYRGCCYWWLRSPGSSGKTIASIAQGGLAESDDITDMRNGVRPALRIDLASSGLYSYAGTVKTVSSSKKVEPVKVSKITLTGISKRIARGKKIRLTATVLPKNAANKKLTWSTSNKKLATVTMTGWVTIAKKATPGKTVKITAAAKDGSGKKQVYKITVMKGAVKKITVKGYKKKLKVGKSMQLKAVVKITKGKPVNKRLKWTSSNPKYATVTQTGKVKAKPAGKGKTVKIKVMSTDGTNKSVVKKIKIK